MKYLLEERFLLVEADEEEDDEDLEPEEASEAPADKPKQTTEPSKNINWEQEFKQCKTPTELEQFWKKYFQHTFGETATDIQSNFQLSLKYIIKQYGWLAKENPFIKFFQQLDKPDIANAQKFGWTNTLFTNLANAAEANKFNPKDLVDSPLGAYDLLNNLEFKKATGSSTWFEWLEFRGKAVMRAKNQNDTTGQQGLIFANCFLLNGSTADKLTRFDPKMVVSGKLADLKQARRRWKQLTGEEIEEKQAANEESISKLVEKLQGDPRILFYFGYDVFPIIVPNCLVSLGKEIESVFKAERAKQQKALTIEQTETCKKALNLASTKYDAKTAGRLLYLLLEKAKVKLPELPEQKKGNK